jgi:hypothetical protein
MTEMGQALRAVLDAMGRWGAHWLEIEPRHMDPTYVLWATMKLIDLDKVPAQTTVVRFALRDRPTASCWLILRRPQPGAMQAPQWVRRGHRVPHRLGNAAHSPTSSPPSPPPQCEADDQSWTWDGGDCSRQIQP